MAASKLYCGDCRKILKTLPPDSVNAVVTDPPYGIALADHDPAFSLRKSDRTIVGDADQSAGLSLIVWAEQHRLPIAAFASPYRPWPGQWRNLLVWDKGPATGRGGDPKTCWKRTWELIQVARNPRFADGRPQAVLRHFVRPDCFTNHPAQKPVSLLIEIIEAMTKRGDTVLDPFMGSGSTGVACRIIGRNFIGIEIDPDHFAVAKRRLSEARPRKICVS